MLFGISFLGTRYVFVSVNVCVYVGEGLRRSFATPNPFVLTNKICLNQLSKYFFPNSGRRVV